MTVKILQAEKELIECGICNMKSEMAAELSTNSGSNRIVLCAMCAGEIHSLLNTTWRAFSDARIARMARQRGEAHSKC